MTNGVIAVFDDEESIMNRYERDLTSVDEINSVYRVKQLGAAEFVELLNELIQRQIHSREGTIEYDDWNNDIDEADVLVIDYDLTHKEGLRNGEEISYLVGCFSKCKYVILLNRLGESVFDLTFSRTSDSNADLNISSSDLSNDGLWTGVSRGYRPWYWPALINYINSHEDRIQHIEENISLPLHELLGFSEEIIRSISMSAGERLGLSPERIVEATAIDFLRHSDSVLHPKDRKITFPQELLIKIISTKIFSWMERFILQGQDILVDAPHLISSYPSLLLGDPEDKSVLDRTARLGRESELGIDLDRIREFEYENINLVSRSYWYRSKISKSGNILENTKPSDRRKLLYVFAEDASQFFPKIECRECLTGLDTPLRRRYVKGDFDRIHYSPVRNLLLGEQI